MIPRCAVWRRYDRLTSTTSSLGRRRAVSTCARRLPAAAAAATLTTSSSSSSPHPPQHLHGADPRRRRPHNSSLRTSRGTGNTLRTRPTHAHSSSSSFASSHHERRQTTSSRTRRRPPSPPLLSRRSFAAAATASPLTNSNDDLFSSQPSTASAPQDDVDNSSPEGRLHDLTKHHSFLCDEAERFFEKTESASDHVFVTEKQLQEKNKAINALEKELELVKDLPAKVAELKAVLDGSDRDAEEQAKREIAERLACYFWKRRKFDRIRLQNIVFSILADPSLKPAVIWNDILKTARYPMIELSWMTERVRGVNYVIDLSHKERWLGKFNQRFRERVQLLQGQVKALADEYEQHRPKFDEAQKKRDEYANIAKTELAQRRTDLGEAQRSFETVSNHLLKITERIERHCELYEIPLPELREGRHAQSMQDKIGDIMSHLSAADERTMKALTSMGKVTEAFELQQGTPKSDASVDDDDIDIVDNEDDDDSAAGPQEDDDDIVEQLDEPDTSQQGLREEENDD